MSRIVGTIFLEMWDDLAKTYGRERLLELFIGLTVACSATVIFLFTVRNPFASILMYAVLGMVVYGITLIREVSTPREKRRQLVSVQFFFATYTAISIVTTFLSLVVTLMVTWLF